MPNSDEVLKTAREASIQSRARGDSSSGLSLLMLLGPVAGGIVSPWWSRKRDSELRRFWRQIDHLSGAVYTMESRLKTIPFHIEPRDMNVRSHVKQAEQIDRKSTRLNSSHSQISYSRFCFKKKYIRTEKKKYWYDTCTQVAYIITRIV